jgi:hypothetical protein
MSGTQRKFVAVIIGIVVAACLALTFLFLRSTPSVQPITAAKPGIAKAYTETPGLLQRCRRWTKEGPVRLLFGDSPGACDPQEREKFGGKLPVDAGSGKPESVTGTQGAAPANPEPGR